MKKYIPILLVAAIACSSAQLSAFGTQATTVDLDPLKALKKISELKVASNKKQGVLNERALKLKAKDPALGKAFMDILDAMKKRMGDSFKDLLLQRESIPTAAAKRLGINERVVVADKALRTLGIADFATDPDKLLRWTLGVNINHYETVEKLMKLETATLDSMEKMDKLLETSRMSEKEVEAMRIASKKAKDQAAKKAAKKRK